MLVLICISMSKNQMVMKTRLFGASQYSSYQGSLLVYRVPNPMFEFSVDDVGFRLTLKL